MVSPLVQGLLSSHAVPTAGVQQVPLSLPPPQLQLAWMVSPLVQGLLSSHAVPTAGSHTVVWHSGSVQTFPGTKVPPPVQVVAVEKSVQTPAADLQHPGTLHVSPPTQAGSS